MRARLPPGQRPRAVIIKVNNFQDKVRVMQAAMKAQALSYNGTSIMIFEDFSAAVVKKRQDFYLAKQQLKERGIVYLLYPAVLRIRYDGQGNLRMLRLLSPGGLRISSHVCLK